MIDAAPLESERWSRSLRRGWRKKEEVKSLETKSRRLRRVSQVAVGDGALFINGRRFTCGSERHVKYSLIKQRRLREAASRL